MIRAGLRAEAIAAGGQVALAPCANRNPIDYRRSMRRLDVFAIVLGVVAGAFGVSAGTGPLAGGLAVLILAGIALRARSAEYIAVWAVVPLLVWATFPDPSMIVAAIALAVAALCALLGARERREVAGDELTAARVTLTAAMVVTAGALLSFDLLLR
jgi:hypothetical protein